MVTRLRRILSGRRSEPAPPRLSFGSWDAFPREERVAVVCHPAWRGVRTAAHSSRAPVIETTDVGAGGEHLVRRLRDAGVEVLVVHGFPPGSDELIRRAAAAGLATRCILHSSMAQHGAEAGEAEVVDRVLALAAEGPLGRVGFVKEGLAEAFAALGHQVAYVPNRVPVLPRLDKLDLGGDALNVGVFAEPFWRKNVVTQLGAVALLDRARAHVLVLPEVGYLGALQVVEHGLLPWEEFLALQGSVDLNLYVTLSECQPQTPLESYAAGIPCLFSRTSALFRDDPELWELSTVDEDDNPRAIAGGAKRLLAATDTAVARAQAWMKLWDGRAVERWQEFVAA